MTTDVINGVPRELKPCPFCGGKAEIEQVGTPRKSTIYRCTDCSCSLETGETFNHGAGWNERALLATAQPAADGEREAIYMMRRMDQDAWYVTTFQTFDHINSGKSPQHQAVKVYAKPQQAVAVTDEVRRLREAMELIADTDPDDGTSWFHDVANAALTQSPKGEEE